MRWARDESLICENELEQLTLLVENSNKIYLNTHKNKLVGVGIFARQLRKTQAAQRVRWDGQFRLTWRDTNGIDSTFVTSFDSPRRISLKGLFIWQLVKGKYHQSAVSNKELPNTVKASRFQKFDCEVIRSRLSLTLNRKVVNLMTIMSFSQWKVAHMTAICQIYWGIIHGRNNHHSII